MLTEAEWFACKDPHPMLEYLRGRVSERKMRLMACAVSYRYAVLVAGGWYESALLTAEEFADSHTATPEVVALRSQATSVFRELLGRYFSSDRRPNRSYYGGQVSALQHLFSLISDDAHLNVPVNLVWYATSAYPLAEPGDEEVAADEGRGRINADLADYPAFLREVVGNPFHSIACDSSWRTDTVLALARQMYEARDFSAMPVLADALQDAGCDNEDVLCHCRDTSLTHVRGCWCVDLVLERE